MAWGKRTMRSRRLRETRETKNKMEEKGKMEFIKKFWNDDEGATAVEYGIMVALIAAVIVTVVGVLGGQVNAAFQTVSDAL